MATTPIDFLTYFSNHEGDIQFEQSLVWSKIVQRGVRQKKSHDNTTKDNVTVVSSNISQNNETIRILKILKS